MEQIILIFHTLAALAIVGLILIQQGKGADMGASFGAGASQTLFGSSGSGNALTKATSIVATFFFATSLALAVVAKNKAESAEDVDLPLPAAEETINTDALEEAGTIAPQPAEEIPTMDGATAPQTGDDIPAMAGSESTGDDIPSMDAAGEAGQGSESPATQSEQPNN